MADIGQIDNYSFGRSGNSNILTNEIVYEPITNVSLNSYDYNVPPTNYITIPLSTYDNLNEISTAKLLSILITTTDNFIITGIATSANVDTTSGKITSINWDTATLNYILNNSSLNIPVMKDNVTTLYLRLNKSVKNVTINGVWLQLNNADANFFQLQSQMAGLQMQASSIIQQLNNAMQYCNSITSMTSKYGKGDIYITTSDRDPSTIYGGTWEKQNNCILVGAKTGDNVSSDSVKPEKYPEFTISKSIPTDIYCRLESSYIPAHTHRMGYWT